MKQVITRCTIQILLRVIPILVVGSLTPPSLEARTWRVVNDGNGDAPFIQAAIESAGVGDEILVGPGTYLENLDFLGKAVAVRSEMGFATTILDGSTQEDSSTVVLRRGEPKEALLEGFTIIGGTGSSSAGLASCAGLDDGGGGLWCDGSPIIRGNYFYRDKASNGGGILVRGGDPLIEGNTFKNNDAESGGGICVDGQNSSPTIRNNVFRENTGYDCGGCIAIILSQGNVLIEENEFIENGFGSAAATVGAQVPYASTGFPAISLKNNLFSQNYSCNSVEVALYDVSGLVSHNTFYGALCSSAFGCRGCSFGALNLYQLKSNSYIGENIFANGDAYAITCDESTVEFGINLSWENAVGDFGPNCADSAKLKAILADPLFCDPENGDLHLAENSPAILGETILGNYLTPGCGPVLTQPLTWGLLKTLYH